MGTRLNIILVEDHSALRAVTTGMLEQEGHKVLALSCAEDLEDHANASIADLFILDLNLPGEDGLSLARRLRAVHPQVGIIMVTGRDQSRDVLDGYLSGADLYLVKPLDPQVLSSAIISLARRLKPVIARRREICVETSRLQLRNQTTSLPLTLIELRLLTGLARAPGQRLAQFQLGELSGQDDEAHNKRSLEVRIARLRKKLIELGAPVDCIKALRNEGYQLCTPIQIR